MSLQPFNIYAGLTPVRLAATTNQSATYLNGPLNNGVGATLTYATGALTIDGASVVVGDRILIPAQTSANQNGIYMCTQAGATGVAAVLTRAVDMQNIEQYKSGQYVSVSSGTANVGTIWVLNDPLPGILGISNMVWSIAGTQQSASVAMTAAQFNGMYAAPVAMIAAPGANRLIVVDRAVLLMTYGSANYASGGVVGFQYDSTVNGAGAKATNTEAAADFFAAASTSFQFVGTSGNTVGAVPFSTSVNKGLYLSNATGAFTTGDSTWVAKIYYRIVSVA